MPWIEWYTALEKPSWTPAPATIGLTWQILYPIILVSFGFVFVQTFRGKISWLVALPFASGGYSDRVGDNHLDDGCSLAAPSLGRRGPGSVLHMGFAGDGAATLDHGDELGEAMIRSGL